MTVRMRRLWSYPARIWDSYNRHLGDLMAAAVSFYALLSMVPLLSVGVAILGWAVGGSVEAIQKLSVTMQDYLPVQGNLIFDALTAVKRDRGLLGLIGLGGLLFSASAIFTKLGIAFNTIWGGTTERGWIRLQLASIGNALLTLILMISSIAITSFLTYLQNARVPGLAFRPAEIPLLWKLLGHLLPLVISVVMFALLYRNVPCCEVSWRAAFLGGVFAGGAWELAKYLFALYLSHFGTYDKVYGSLGGLVILMVWAYYSATILMLGAEIAADYGKRVEVISSVSSVATPDRR